MWNELVKAALLGIDRTELGVSVLAELEANGVDTTQASEKVLATGLAYHRFLYKTARRLETFAGPLPAPVEEAGARLCSPKTSRHLRMILEGDFSEALSEFSRQLKAAGKSLPPESLPALLNLCLSDPELWKEIEPAIGARGYWLIGLNPAWQPLHPQVGPDEWPDADLAERLIILRQLRESQPAAATALLKGIWPEIDHREKSACLQVFSIGLSPADEPFLESCLDDGRKPVRQAAASLLAQVKKSALVERLFQFAATLLTLEKDKLTIALPPELTKELQRDGIEDTTRDYLRPNQQLGWFLQIVERIPPQRWQQHFDLAPEALITLAKRADKTKNLVRALARAALLHQDTNWLGALAHHWELEQDEVLSTSNLGQEVLAGLSTPKANSLVIHYLERNHHLLDERSLAHQLLGLGVHPWEDRLSLLLINGFKNWLGGSDTFYGNRWHYKRLLKIAAFRVNPDLLPKLQTGWPTQSRIWALWEAEVEQMMRTLTFRKEMIAELQKD